MIKNKKITITPSIEVYNWVKKKAVEQKRSVTNYIDVLISDLYKDEILSKNNTQNTIQNTIQNVVQNSNVTSESNTQKNIDTPQFDTVQKLPVFF